MSANNSVIIFEQKLYEQKVRCAQCKYLHNGVLNIFLKNDLAYRLLMTRCNPLYIWRWTNVFLYQQHVLNR